MKKIKGYVAIVILIISWFALYYLTGSRLPWQFYGTINENGISAHLGDIPNENYDRMGFTKGHIKYIKHNNMMKYVN